MRWRRPRLAAGAVAVLAVVFAVVPGVGSRDDGGAAIRSSSPAGRETPALAPIEIAESAPAGPVPGHRHDVDPVSAGLLVVDGLVVLAVAVLLMRRPRRPRPPRRPRRPAAVGR